MPHRPDKPIYTYCPLCDSLLSGGGYDGSSICPNGHYKYIPNGSYASTGIIIINGVEECYGFDDMFDDSDKFYARVDELRELWAIPDTFTLKDPNKLRTITEPFEPSVEQ